MHGGAEACMRVYCIYQTSKSTKTVKISLGVTGVIFWERYQVYDII